MCHKFISVLLENTQHISNSWYSISGSPPNPTTIKIYRLDISNVCRCRASVIELAVNIVPVTCIFEWTQYIAVLTWWDTAVCKFEWMLFALIKRTWRWTSDRGQIIIHHFIFVSAHTGWSLDCISVSIIKCVCVCVGEVNHSHCSVNCSLSVADILGHLS